MKKEEIKEIIEDLWDNICKPFKAVKWWILYRTTLRYHVVNVGNPGYRDADHLLKEAMWKILVDFIEIESAHMNIWCNNKKRTKLYWIKRRLGLFRSAKEGLAFQQFQVDSKDSCKENRKAHKDIINLYKWYTKELPKFQKNKEKEWKKHRKSFPHKGFIGGDENKEKFTKKYHKDYHNSLKRLGKMEHDLYKLELQKLSELILNCGVLWT